MSVQVKAKKTFGKQAEKKDKSSELFDAMMSSPKKTKPPAVPTRTSPRKKAASNSNPQDSSPPETEVFKPKAKLNSKKISPKNSNPFEFTDNSPPQSVSQGLQLSDDEEDDSPLEMNSQSSQSSLSGKVSNVSLHSPPLPSKSKIDDTPPSSQNGGMEGSPPKKSKILEEDKVVMPKKPVYKHTWSGDGEEEGNSLEFKDYPSTEPAKFKEPLPKAETSAGPPPRRFFKSGLPPGKRAAVALPPKSSSESDLPQASMRCVARKVKEAEKCLEDGEAQEYRDEVQYILETLKSADSPELKCLTMMSLSRKCLKTSFRQFLRAKNVPTHLFSMLLDSDKCNSLAMCTSLFLYLLARDRLSLAIDSRTLQLILRLINFKPNKDEPSYAKYKSQCWEVLSTWKAEVVESLTEQQASVFKFDATPSNISPNFLVVEAFVFISTRKTDANFKDAVRQFGGLQLVVQAVEQEMAAIKGSVKVDFFEHLKMLQRYLRILENVTLMHEPNQMILISHRGCVLIDQCINLLHVCRCNLSNMSNAALLQSAHRSNSDPVKLLDESLSAVIKLLCNLSNNNELCCIRLGQSDTFIGDCLALVTFVAPTYLPPDLRFDLVVLVTGLLSNVVEHCSENRRRVTECTVPFCTQTPSATDEEIIDSDPVNINAVEALTKLLLGHLAAAENADAEMDEHMERPFAQAKRDAQQNMPVRMPSAQDLKKTVADALHKASEHMEDTILASYIALLLGLLVQHSEDVMSTVRQLIPSHNFTPMVDVLNKFLEFMDMAQSSSEHKKGQKVIARIIESLQDLDK